MERDYLELINAAYGHIVSGHRDNYHLNLIDGTIDINKTDIGEITITIKRKSIISNQENDNV